MFKTKKKFLERAFMEISRSHLETFKINGVYVFACLKLFSWISLPYLQLKHTIKFWIDDMAHASLCCFSIPSGDLHIFSLSRFIFINFYYNNS